MRWEVFTWAALAYAAGTFAPKLRALQAISSFLHCGLWFWEAFATWFVLAAAAVAPTGS